jgi:hypothetical protein
MEIKPEVYEKGYGVERKRTAGGKSQKDGEDGWMI